MTDTCLCGAWHGHPHDYTCPYPLYRATAVQADRWLAARAAARVRRLAELQKRPNDSGGLTCRDRGVAMEEG